jgi:hypothetical protein
VFFFLPANAPMRRQKKEERKEQRKRKAKIGLGYLYANCKPNKEIEHQITGTRNTKKKTSEREPHKTVQKAVCAFVSPSNRLNMHYFYFRFFFFFSFFFYIYALLLLQASVCVFGGVGVLGWISEDFSAPLTGDIR